MANLKATGVAQCETSKGRIEKAFNRCLEKRDELFNIIANLNQKFDSVLGPEAPPSPSEDCEKESTSHWTRTLERYGDDIDSAIYILRDIIERCEL